MNRVREYWEVNNLQFSNLTETDINALGEFVAGLALEELRKLPGNVLHSALKRLGEKLDLPEDKLRARAFLAIQLIKVQFCYTACIVTIGAVADGDVRMVVNANFLELRYSENN